MEEIRTTLSQITTEDLLTLAGEFTLVAALFLLVGWFLRRLLKALHAAPALARFGGVLDTVRKNLRTLLFLVFVVTALALAATNALWLYRGHRLLPYTLELVRDVPPDFWRDLAFSLAKIVGLMAVATMVIRWSVRGLDWLCEKFKAWEGLGTNDDSVEMFFDALVRLVRRGGWLAVLAYSLQLLGLPASIPATAFAIVSIYLTIGVGLAIWRAIDAIVESLDALSRKYSSDDNLLRFYGEVEHLVPLFRRALEWVIYVTVAGMVVRQIQPIADLADYWPVVVRIIGILFLSRVAVEVTRIGAQELLIRRARLDSEQRQRRLTLIPLIESALKYLVYFGATIIILKELGQDVTPVLAGAGILGLAVGLGAQNLINDLVSGFFILFEDYYLVGDYVEVAEAEGVVERIDLRTTWIRDDDGRLHIVRNGNIEKVLHYSKPYSVAVVQVTVAYDNDLDKVFEVLTGVSDRLVAEEPQVLEPCEIRGLEEFSDWGMVIEIETKVKPGLHLDLARDIRRRIKTAFDEAGVVIGRPQGLSLAQYERAGGEELESA